MVRGVDPTKPRGHTEGLVAIPLAVISVAAPDPSSNVDIVVAIIGAVAPIVISVVVTTIPIVTGLVVTSPALLLLSYLRVLHLMHHHPLLLGDAVVVVGGCLQLMQVQVEFICYLLVGVIFSINFSL